MAESPQPTPQEPSPSQVRRLVITGGLTGVAGVLGLAGAGLIGYGQGQADQAERTADVRSLLATTEAELAAASSELAMAEETNAELLRELNAQAGESLEVQRHQAFQAIKDFEATHAGSSLSQDVIANHASLISRLRQFTYPSSLTLHQIHTTPRLVPPDQIGGVHAKTIRSTTGQAEILISDQFPPPAPNLDRLTQLRLLLEHQLVYASTPFPYSEPLADGSTLYHLGFQRVTVDTAGNRTGIVGHQTILWQNVDATAAALLAVTMDPEISLNATDPYVTSVFGEPTAQKIGALMTLLQAAEINPTAIANLYFLSQPLAFAASVDILLRRRSNQIPEGFTPQMLTLIDEGQLTLFRQRMNSLPFPQPGQEVNT